MTKHGCPPSVELRSRLLDLGCHRPRVSPGSCPVTGTRPVIRTGAIRPIGEGLCRVRAIRTALRGTWSRPVKGNDGTGASSSNHDLGPTELPTPRRVRPRLVARVRRHGAPARLLQREGVVENARPWTPARRGGRTCSSASARRCCWWDFSCGWAVGAENLRNALGSFGRSSARRYHSSGERVTFADVAGVDEAKPGRPTCRSSPWPPPTSAICSRRRRRKLRRSASSTSLDRRPTGPPLARRAVNHPAGF